MRAKLAPEDQMTIDEFLAFADARPDGERWELIEGVAVMNAAPVDWHQVIVQNLSLSLMAERARLGAVWFPMPGIGVRVPASPQSLPQPDFLVKASPLAGTHLTDDAIVLFEVLSKSNTRADQAWRRRVYASVPNCQHYVTISHSAVAITRYDRVTKWQPSELNRLDQRLELPALGNGAAIAVADIYRWTPAGPA